MKIYSQLDEQIKLIEIFDKIKTKNKISIEFGSMDGYKFSNTRYFTEHEEWQGYFIDADTNYKNVINKFITVENVNNIFDELNLPHSFDLLSIDIDGNDYWIWQALQYKPRVVVIEYNCAFNKNVSCSIKYNTDFIFNNDSYFGASFLAMKKLGHNKGYKLMYVNKLNMIFVLGLELPVEYDDNKIDYKIDYSGWGRPDMRKEWVKV